MRNDGNSEVWFVFDVFRYIFDQMCVCGTEAPLYAFGSSSFPYQSHSAAGSIRTVLVFLLLRPTYGR